MKAIHIAMEAVYVTLRIIVLSPSCTHCDNGGPF
jgi:hypothetical protein